MGAALPESLQARQIGFLASSESLDELFSGHLGWCRWESCAREGGTLSQSCELGLVLCPLCGKVAESAGMLNGKLVMVFVHCLLHVKNCIFWNLCLLQPMPGGGRGDGAGAGSGRIARGV